MNTSLIAGIKAKLKTMYVGYQFTIKPVESSQTFLVSVAKNNESLGSLSLPATTSMTEVWVLIKAWMLTVINR